MVVDPNDVDALAPAIQEAVEAKIPVVTIRPSASIRCLGSLPMSELTT